MEKEAITSLVAEKGYPHATVKSNVTFSDDRTQAGERGGRCGSLDFRLLTRKVPRGRGTHQGLVDIVPNPKGAPNANQGDASGKGSSASDAGPNY